MEQYTKSSRDNQPIITIILIVLNVVYFFYMRLTGSLYTGSGLVESGAMYISDGSYMGGIREILLAMFIHFDIYHIGSNMLSLIAVGELLERAVGRIPYLITYLVSGIMGNVATILVYGIQGRSGISAGASGAVFGLMGLLAILVLLNRRNENGARGFSSVRNRVFIMVFLMLYSGFRDPQINMIAHVAGLLTGAACGLIIIAVRRRKRF